METQIKTIMTGDNAAVHLRICAANGGRWWALDFEGYLAAIYRWLLRPGMVAVDCGANLGIHTLQMARAVEPGGLVVAIEPIGELVARLREEMRESLLPENLVRIVQCCVSNARGTADFYQIDHPLQHGLSGLRKREYSSGVVAKPVVVEVRTLDDLCADLPRLDFLKLDIEGAEFDALRGGMRILRKFRPVIAMEQSQTDPQYFGYSWAELLAFLEEMEYQLFDFFGLAYARAEQLQNCMVWDFVALPREYGYRASLFAAVRDCMMAAGVKGLDVEDPHAAVERGRAAVVEGCLVRRPGNEVEDHKVYFVEQGTKRWVTSAEWIVARGMNWPGDVRIIPAEELAALLEGPPLP